MRCIISQSYNPYFNLAAEEFLLKEYSGDVFMLWISKPAVVVGKHQNTLAEVNYRYVFENNILVARRLSGGGAVYHDEGNINFTFITNEQIGKLIDFRRYIDPVIQFLQQTGVNANIGAMNEILINSFKISGNAEHIYKNRVLHHGTLLFNTNLDCLRNSLAVMPGRYHSIAVKSNPSAVTNVANFLRAPMPIKDFCALFTDYIRNLYHGELINFTAEEIKEIEQLSSEKYSNWDWIYGYSPDYRFFNTFTWSGSRVTIEFTCKKGIIGNLEIRYDAGKGLSEILTASLAGCRHGYSFMLQAIENYRNTGNSLTESLHGLLLNLL
jgi:lipoate-protein ligase A